MRLVQKVLFTLSYFFPSINLHVERCCGKLSKHMHVCVHMIEIKLNTKENFNTYERLLARRQRTLDLLYPIIDSSQRYNNESWIWEWAKDKNNFHTTLPLAWRTTSVSIRTSLTKRRDDGLDWWYERSEMNLTLRADQDAYHVQLLCMNIKSIV